MSDERTRRLESIYYCLQVLKEETRHLRQLSALIGITADIALTLRHADPETERGADSIAR